MAYRSSGTRTSLPVATIVSLAILLGGLGASVTPAFEVAQANVLSCSGQSCCTIPCVDIGYAGPEMVPGPCSVNTAAPCWPATFCDLDDTVADNTFECPGPLVNVWVGNDLSCQVNRRGDAQWQVYPPSTKPGDCGTLVWDGTTLFAANFAARTSASWSIGTRTEFQPVSQTVEYASLAGLGGMPEPPATAVTNKATTDVTLPGTTMSITQIDLYTSGEDWFTTQTTVSNSGATDRSIILYRALDCYLGGSDQGYGFLDTTQPGAVGCSKNPDNSPPGRVEELIPLTAGSRYYEQNYGEVWRWIGTHQPFPDTCVCPSFIDNGIGLSWNLLVPAGGSVTVSSKLLFSKVYIPPPPPPPRPPVAEFKADSLDEECGPHPISFKDASEEGTSPILLWSWDFGDGTGSVERNPTHTYDQPGSYSVTETVTDANGTTSSFSLVVEATAGEPCKLPGRSQDDGQVQRPPRDDVDQDIAGDDRDGDFVPDRLDNCPRKANPTQGDLDGDDVGDACDPDRDGDTILDGADNCFETTNKAQADLEGDGIGDACDSDMDGDLRSNGDDNCPRAANGDQSDGDGDNVGDACDITTAAVQTAPASVDAARDPKAAAQAATGASVPWVPAAIGAAALVAAAVLVGIVVGRRK